jgi:hypothetical protein
VNKQDNREVRKDVEHEESTKVKKNKGKKKKLKTAGLIIPPPKPTPNQQSLSIAKLSSLLQSNKSQTTSKLNQFLK